MTKPNISAAKSKAGRSADFFDSIDPNSPCDTDAPPVTHLHDPIAFAVLSAAMNWSYGVSRGTSEQDQWLIGAVSVSAKFVRKSCFF